MDFLEIRRKAKERAAARAAAAAQAGPAPDPGVPRRALALDPLPLPPVEGGGLSPTPEPLPAASPVPVPTPASSPAFSPTPASAAEEEAARPWTARPPEPAVEPAEAPPAAPDPDSERLAAETAAEAARIEAELEARLREMPAAGDGRFLTWRPSGGAASDLAPIAPPDGAGERAPPAAHGRGGAAEGRAGRRRDAPGPPAGDAAPDTAAPEDPLDDFFYHPDERGPALGALAAPAEAAEAAAEPAEQRVEYLTFLLGAEEYGVEIDRVREVMRSPPITEVPRAPADVLGVITVRGEVVPVFDPRGRLGLPPGGSGEGGRVIIVDDGAGPCGLLVDGVASVVRLPRGSIEARPQGIGGASADCLEGIGRDQDRLFTVLSIAALLKPARRAEGRT